MKGEQRRGGNPKYRGERGGGENGREEGEGKDGSLHPLEFLADRTNGRAIGTVLRLSVCLSVCRRL